MHRLSCILFLNEASWLHHQVVPERLHKTPCGENECHDQTLRTRIVTSSTPTHSHSAHTPSGDQLYNETQTARGLGACTFKAQEGGRKEGRIPVLPVRKKDSRRSAQNTPQYFHTDENAMAGFISVFKSSSSRIPRRVKFLF